MHLSEQLTAIEHTSSTQFIRISPNPADRTLHITLPQDKAAQYTLLNLSGIAVSKGRLLQPVTDIDVSDIPAGTYLMRITQGGEVYTDKIVIAHP